MPNNLLNKTCEVLYISLGNKGFIQNPLPYAGLKKNENSLILMLAYFD